MTTAPTRPDRHPQPALQAFARRAALPCALLLFVALVVLSLNVGVYDLNEETFGSQMFWITRVPRTASLVLAGVAMSICGLIMQMLTQNKFVEPTTVGTTEWAGLGLLISYILLPRTDITNRIFIAAAFAFVGTMIFMWILRRISLRTSLVVPLIGIMFGAVVGAFSTFLAVSTDRLQLVGTWFMGSFTGVVRGRYELLWIVAIVVVIIYIAADRFTVAGLGRDIATNVGVNYNRMMLIGTGLVAMATSLIVVIVGFLPFLGLVVPNIVSMIRGDDLRSNTPWVCLGGATLVICADIIGRTIRYPFEVPVGMILGVFGGAVFIALLLRQRRKAT